MRHSGIAAILNHLIEHGLDGSENWALRINIDVWHFQTDIIARLTETVWRITTPDCTKFTGEGSFNLNSFVTTCQQRNYRYC